MADGEDRWGTWTTEHFRLKSEGAPGSDAYTNAYWCCLRCNLSRDRRPNETPDGALLDPCEETWESRFRYEGYRLEPRDPQDRDADRTRSAYDLNDPGKVKRRQKRAEALADAWSLWREVQATWPALSPVEPSFYDDVRTTHRNERLAWSILSRYRAVPASSVSHCRCGLSQHCRLPGWLDEQCTGVTEPTPQVPL
jgi:hypothetical protein